MNIYKIEGRGEHTGETGSYESHVIAANSVEEVVRLAKDHALTEGPNSWNKLGVQQIGIYTGTNANSYIILSHLIYDAS